MSLKALVTGGTGFIGSHLVEKLASKNWDVTCLVRPTSRTEFLKKLPVKLTIHETGELESLESAVKGQDYVFHLAGRIRPSSRATYDKSNHQLTKNLAQACLKKNTDLKRFVYVSSHPRHVGYHPFDHHPSSQCLRTQTEGNRASDTIDQQKNCSHSEG
jgi:dihydroflavonol-4-reductase